MKNQIKKRLLAGTILIIFAFICVAGMFYFIFAEQRFQSRENTTLKEKILAINAERDVAESQAERLQKKVGQSINLKKLVNESEKYNSPQEARRKEGYLWIDRKRNTLLVTLGILNGVSTGTRLTVYDGNNQAGFVRVEMPLDVISYAYPVNQAIEDFDKDYYRVVMEE